MCNGDAGLEVQANWTRSKFAHCEVLAFNPKMPQRGEEPIGDSGVEVLAASLFRMHRLRRLDLSNNDITVQGLGVLMKALKHSSTLEVLILDGNRLGDAGAKIIGKLLQRRHANRNLHYISLRECGITAEGVLDLVDRFNHPFVKQVELGRNRIGDTGALILADAIADGAVTNVRYWGLESNGIETAGALALVEAAGEILSTEQSQKNSATTVVPISLDLEQNSIAFSQTLSEAAQSSGVLVYVAGNPIVNPAVLVNTTNNTTPA